MKCKICGSYSRNHNCVTVNSIRKKIWNIRNGFRENMITGYMEFNMIDHMKIGQSYNANRTIPK